MVILIIPPPKIGKNMIFWRKIVIFHTKYPNNFRASLRPAQFFFKCAPLLTWNPGSVPVILLHDSYFVFLLITLHLGDKIMHQITSIRCSVYLQKLNSTDQLKVRGHFTLVLRCELFSLLKAELLLWNVGRQ